MPRDKELSTAEKARRLKRQKYNDFREAVFVCEQCPNLVKSRKNSRWGKATFGYGNVDSPTIFVGEAPGLNGCSYTGIPFTRDASGKLYNWVLNYLGLTLEDVYTTNIVKCWPSDRSGKNRTPTITEVRACLPHFLNELSVVKPAGIVALGRVPEKILRQYKASYPGIGVLNVPIKYIRHPAYILRTGGYPNSDLAKEYAKEFMPYLGVKENDLGETKSLDDYF